MITIDMLVRELTVHRLGELKRLKESGMKIIGYPPGNYLPEELIYACGAVPVCLFRGGDPEAVAESGAYIVRFLDTFCRSQIGYWSLKEDPIYQMVDLITFPITDINQKAIADCWNFYTNTEVFRYGVPHTKSELAFNYYVEGLRLLRKKLQEFTGNRITDDKLKEGIELYNRMKKALREISLLRRGDAPPISGRDFVRLNHASYLLDPVHFVGQLESILEDLRKRKAEIRSPRLLLTAATLAFGDYKVLNLAEDTGAAIVIEEIPEGLRYYWDDVSLEGDPIVELAKVYYMKKPPPAFFRPSTERLDFILDLAQDFRVNAIIWYQLLYRESYDIQSAYFSRMVKDKLGIPMLKLQSDYDVSETGPFRTRIETLVETVKQGGTPQKSERS